MPNADFDLLRGIGLMECYFRAVFREFFSPKTALFSFFTKNIVKFLCLRKEEFRLAYLYNEEDCDCRYCLYCRRRKCRAVRCCCLEDKVRTRSPVLNENDKEIYEFYTKGKNEHFQV